MDPFFDELVAAWKLQFSNIVLLGDSSGRGGSDLASAVGPAVAEEQNSTGLLWHHLLLANAFWLPCTMNHCWARCPSSAWTWQHPDGQTRLRIDYVALPEAWKHLQIQAFNHSSCDTSMGPFDRVVTVTGSCFPLLVMFSLVFVADPLPFVVT